MRRASVGFTFVEMVFAVAIVAIVASSVFVTMSGYRERRRVEESYVFLKSVADSLHAYKRVVGKYPARLNHLTTLIDGSRASNYTGDCGTAALCRTICGAGSLAGAGTGTYNYTPADATAWTNNGPFFHRIMAVGGTPIAIGTLSDVLVRIPAVAPNLLRRRADMQMQILNVPESEASRLDKIVDGIASSSTGTIRWTAATVDGRVPTVLWQMTIINC